MFCQHLSTWCTNEKWWWESWFKLIWKKDCACRNSDSLIWNHTMYAYNLPINRVDVPLSFLLCIFSITFHSSTLVHNYISISIKKKFISVLYIYIYIYMPLNLPHVLNTIFKPRVIFLISKRQMFTVRPNINVNNWNDVLFYLGHNMYYLSALSDKASKSKALQFTLR